MTMVMDFLKGTADIIVSIPKNIEEACHLDAEILNLERSVQIDGYSCGAQCAFSILKFWDREMPIHKVKARLRTDERGYTSQSSLYSLFRKKGLSISERKRAKIRDIREAIDDYESPFLTTVYDENHWCVVYGYSDTKIFVMDPLPLFSSTSCAWDKDEFKDYWDRWGAIIYEK